jgi:hypothetical protein
MLSREKQIELNEKSDRLADRWLKFGWLPHPREMSTPEGFTKWGDMKTPPMNIVLMYAFHVPAITEAVIMLASQHRTTQYQKLLIEAITATYSPGEAADVVLVYHYMRDNFPGQPFHGVSTLIKECDQFNLDPRVMEPFLMDYLKMGI